MPVSSFSASGKPSSVRSSLLFFWRKSRCRSALELPAIPNPRFSRRRVALILPAPQLTPRPPASRTLPPPPDSSVQTPVLEYLDELREHLPPTQLAQTMAALASRPDATQDSFGFSSPCSSQSASDELGGDGQDDVSSALQLSRPAKRARTV
eukprot:m.85602 g.85602  ORF g.85602 m.85602 type:complete len:152 (+) comp8394_c0_seq4:398-853(+)